MTVIARSLLVAGGCVLVVALSGCTKERQNELGRSVQNWTGTNGVLDIYARDVLSIPQKLYVTQSWSLTNTNNMGMHAHSHSNSVGRRLPIHSQ